MKHKIILTILLFSLLTPSLSAKEVPSSGEMLMEPLARVIGLASLVIGTALFIPSAIGISGVSSEARDSPCASAAFCSERRIAAACGATSMVTVCVFIPSG